MKSCLAGLLKRYESVQVTTYEVYEQHELYKFGSTVESDVLLIRHVLMSFDIAKTKRRDL